MTIYYTLVFGILIFEMVGFLLLVIPIPGKARRGIVKQVNNVVDSAHINYTARAVFGFIVILFLDSINRTVRVTAEEERRINITSDRTDYLARRFYAQRNFYLTGFTLFLAIVLNRTFANVVRQLELEEKLLVVTKDANFAYETTSMVKKKDDEIKSLKEKLQQKITDLETLKKQSEGLNKQYESLSEENKKLDAKLRGSSESSKDK
ncbi:hypothetical protein CANCADRAFT_29807 [Tortispora caseinolytica NRRL Y-17796]|uniref:Endoplasmic reticulum transmembrane protein n=1 Tax=Tortispora caseinolytica NRRL Y-17796 TaxID=767744 RepID=A0A1E4T9N5_9ASCO|nr:hypothetical protein CANCADRAFT_29807 [Tortispora caseinolytica NRRL Y-17796]